MKTVSSILLAGLVVLLLCGAAFGADLFTPVLNANSGTIVCQILNTDNAKVVTALINGCDYVLGCNDADAISVEIQPGEAYSFPRTVVSYGYCKFTLSENEKEVRASGCACDDVDEAFSCLNPHNCFRAE